MFGITDLYLFIIAGLLLNITPGVDMLYILNNTFQKGFKTGIVAALGISVGCLFHVFLVVIGLSVILETSIVVFTIIKYFGVVYLIYLGIVMIRKAKDKIELDNPILKSKSLKKVFINGTLINILNPKIAVFFITFLPQFINVDAHNKSMGLIILGLTFIFFGTLVNIIISYISLEITSKFTYSDLFTLILKRVVGILFIIFGLILAMES